MGVAPWAAWAAWFDTLLAWGERGAACWGYFSWNRISEQVSWVPCPGPSPAMLRLKLGEIFPMQESKVTSHPEDGAWSGSGGWTSNAAAEIISGGKFSWDCNLWLLPHLPQTFTTVGFPFFKTKHPSWLCLSGWTFCNPFLEFPPSVRAQPPPRLRYSTQNIGQLEFCKQKLNIPAWPLFPPEGRFALSPCSSRRPGWATSVGMFSNLITYPCLKLFMVH